MSTTPVTQLSLDRWWFKNLKSLAENESLDEMRKIVEMYRIGSILQEDNPELLYTLKDANSLPKELRILVCGKSGAGKSALINGIFTAYENTDIQYYRCIPSVDTSSTATTKLPKTCSLRLKEKDQVKTKITFVDSRGVVSSDREEALDDTVAFLLGNAPSPRRGDKSGQQSIPVLPDIFNRFHLGIICVAADDFDPIMIRLAQKACSEYFPLLFVVTKADKDTGDTLWDEELNVHSENIFVIENYNHATNSVRNDVTDRILLHLLLASIRKAELEGLTAINKEPLQVAWEELEKSVVKRTSNIVNKMDPASIMLIVIVIILMFLVVSVAKSL